jgi:glycosyltransferase involved in cell wall biosynthesis
MFSILIPTFNNLEYLKLCISSIKKNSKFENQIIPHVNVGDDGTVDFLKNENINFTHTKFNSGICEGINKAASLSKFDYLLYAHDDFYFCPNWDEILKNEVKVIGHNKFYLSGTMMHEGQIKFDCGDSPSNFNEEMFLDNYKKYNHYDFQGSTWAPSLVHKDIWIKAGGLSEEFFPGSGSDPDFNMKLWNLGIRIFKGINNFKVYHFGSIVLRDKKKQKKKYGSRGSKQFLIKWGVGIKFFKKFFLRSNKKYDGELKDPNKNIDYYFNLFLNKINFFYIKYIYNFNNKNNLNN